ncbi:MAG: hypothetical protein IH874_09160, partial [Candidatus Dadabacteria bacterium]|nr:hypothetical protein [Candidatus Dadabacteria bacterium]
MTEMALSLVVVILVGIYAIPADAQMQIAGFLIQLHVVLVLAYAAVCGLAYLYG